MNEIPGARESNAGDDFHFIWSAKKALKLLEPNTEFEALCVEGPNIEDSIIFEDDENVLLSIDVAEYFGGKKYEDATKVIFSQLKYSTRHGDLSWTLSSLSAATNVKKDNSIIQRLVQTYKGFLEKYPTDIEKLKLKLVTNRPIEEKFENLIDNCITEIEKNNCTKYFELKKLLNKEYQDYLKLFYDETKLNTTEFIGFVKSIDLSECGTDIRDIQEAEVIESLSKLGILDLKANYDKLIQFIRKQMSPEENEAAPIDKGIMANFFNTIPNGLFPANPQIIKPQEYVKRDVSDDIVKEIITNRKKHICLYATGGIGKTTVISDLENELPRGSVVLLYDCFGGGSYLDPATPLHTYKNAIIQLSNELALKCCTPFLVRTNLDEDEYLKSFSIRFKQASEYIKAINKEAVILVILDAIDNSYYASEFFEDKCFVDKLLKITLPENVSFLVTSRKERLKNFELPYRTAMVELQGFNEREQRRYIDMFYENVSAFQCEEVRRLTNGNPRVQYYIFSKVSKNIDNALQYLNPNGKNLEGIFEEALKKIDTRVPSEIMSFEELCSALVELPRPIPVDIITNSTDYDAERLASACSEYLIGVYFGNGSITFRDEDFEDYLKRTAKSSETVINKIAKILYCRRFDNYYSVRYLHIFLEKSQKLEQILESIYTIKDISISLVEDEKNEIMSKRIKSAFSINDICNKDYRLDVYKLLYLQTKCKSADTGVKEIILENIGLSKKLGFESTISRYILSRSEFNSLNELTLQTYANSLLGNNEQADQFFDTSCIKIKQYLEEKDDDRNFRNRIETSDLSQLAIYIAMRHGAEKAIKWIHGWSPYPAKEYFDVTYSLLLYGDIEKVEFIINSSDDIDMFAACTVAFVELNYSLKDEFWVVGENLTKQIEKEKQIHVSDLKYRISLAEMLLKRGKIKEAKSITDNTEVIMNYSHISFYEMKGELPKKYAFRLYALKKYLKGEEYNFEDFWMHESKGHEAYDKRKIEEEKDKLKKTIDFIISSFFVRVKMIDSNCIDKPSINEFYEEWSNCDKGSYKFYNDHNAYGYYRVIVSNIFCILLTQGKRQVKEYCEKFLVNKYFDNNFHFGIIHDIIQDKKYIDIAAWYLNELDKKMSAYPQSAYDLKEFYLGCSKKAILFDKRLAYEYFNKAINASNGVDDDAYRRIILYRWLSEKYIENENASELAYNFVRIIEDSYRRLDDRSHLPTSDIFKMLAAIHPSSAIAGACRLEDRDEEYATLGFEISIPYIIKELLYENKIPIEIATSLANIDIKDGTTYGDIVELVLKRLSGENKEKIEKIIKVITYDIEKISGGFENGHIVEKVYAWSKKKCDNSIKCIKKLNNAYCFRLENSRDINYNVYENNKISWEKLDKNTIKQNKESLIAKMNAINYKDHRKLIEYVLENAVFEKQLQTIELLIDIMYTVSTYGERDECFKILIYYLNEWSEYNPNIREWRLDEGKLEEVLELYYKNTESFKEKNLVQITRIFLIDKDIILSKLVKKAYTYLFREPWEIFSYIEGMSSIDNGENCSQLLEWCCTEEIINVHSASSDEIYSADKKDTSSIEESLAFYLIKMLGHLEKEKRWYAVHAIYSLWQLNQWEIIDNIVKNIFEDIPELYKDKQYVYFKDIAIVYLLIVLRKIVEEDNLLIMNYIHVLEDIALTSNTINILQRELAKEILIFVKPLSRKIQTACDVAKKENVKCRRRFLHDRQKNKTEFRFDTMDIVPKIYYFLGEIFQKSEGEVMADCDKLISSWGITNEMVDEWDEKYRTDEYQRNSYGLDTSVEDLSKYVQYNAMYYIADEYRKTLSVSNDEDSLYTFEEWIQRWLTSIPGKWVSDIKTLPPNKKIFLDVNRYVTNKKHEINDDIFDKAFWYTYKKQKYFILYNDSSIEYEHSGKHYSMVVGIMDKKYVNKILIQAKEDNYRIDWSFITDEHDNFQQEFIEDVIGEYYGKESSFEKFDPYTNGMNYSLLKPNEEIEHFLKIANVSPEHYSITKDNCYPIKTQYWSYKNEDRMYNLVSEGKMLFIREEVFLKYLHSRPNVVVVTQMDIRYSDGYSRYGEKAEKSERRMITILDNRLENKLEEVEIKIKNRY